ncbi:cation-transporting P-type ATPase [Legionella pneumophila serogroup 1]
MAGQQNISEPAWHKQSVEKTLVALNTTEQGISEQESKKRLEYYDFNRLPEPKINNLMVIDNKEVIFNFKNEINFNVISLSN